METDIKCFTVSAFLTALFISPQFISLKPVEALIITLVGGVLGVIISKTDY